MTAPQLPPPTGKPNRQPLPPLRFDRHLLLIEVALVSFTLGAVGAFVALAVVLS